MPITLGSNIASLKIQQNLGRAGDALSRNFERLSSGLRINRVSDDAAGLAIATSLRADSRVLSQAIRNVSDGISALSISEGALRELANIATRQIELAEQAANGVYTLVQRRALDQEANALVDEYNRIVQSTKFNNTGLLDGTYINNTLSIQAGSGSNSTIAFNIGEELARTIGTGGFTALGSFSASTTAEQIVSADLNGDGNLDLINAEQLSDLRVYLGNGDGSFKAGVSYDAIRPRGVTIADVNGDGNADAILGEFGVSKVSVMLGNGNGSFKAAVSYAAVADARRTVVQDFNGDGKKDIAAVGTGNTVTILLGNSDGTFKASVSYLAAASGDRDNIAIGDVNDDGIYDLAVGGGSSGTSVLLGNSNGSFKLYSSQSTLQSSDVELSDVNHDGLLDLVSGAYTGGLLVQFGNGDGTFKYSGSYVTGSSTLLGIELADINNDGVMDVLGSDGTTSATFALLGSSDGTFRTSVSYALGVQSYGPTAGDFNGDGVVDFANSSTAGQIVVFTGKTTEVTTIARLNLLSKANALKSLTTAQSTLDQINLELGKIGSNESRLSVTSNILAVTRENYRAAESRIMDIDVAEETAQLVRNQILQQAATAMLAQANQQPALAMQLLQP